MHRTPRATPPRTYYVARLVDGHTLELGNGETVRLVGIDTPEVGECGFEAASDALAGLVLGRQVRLRSRGIYVTGPDPHASTGTATASRASEEPRQLQAVNDMVPSPSPTRPKPA